MHNGNAIAAGSMFGGLIFLILLALYLLPTTIAALRSNRQTLAIFVLNLCLAGRC